MSDTASDTLLSLEGAPGLHRRKTGWLPVYVAAALGFAFVLGFGDQASGIVPRVVLGLGSAAVAGVIVLLGQVILTLRGRRRFPYLEEMPTHAALEEEKTQVLAAIKEIEFDHDMSKINDRDYEDLRKRYEAEALRVLKAIDDERRAWEQKAAAMAKGHLSKAGLSLSAMPGPKAKPKEPKEPKKPEQPEAERAEEKSAEPRAPAPKPDAPAEAEAAEPGPTCADCGRENDDDAVFCVGCGARLEPLPRSCPECETVNEPDARFCKKCGTRLEEAGA